MTEDRNTKKDMKDKKKNKEKEDVSTKYSTIVVVLSISILGSFILLLHFD